MLKHFGWLSILAATALAQTPAAEFKASPEVEAALRARVNQFFQYHVDGKFRDAYGMVAEDTKDYYFSAGKNQLKGFKVTGVHFQNAECTQATVDVLVDQDIRRPEFPDTIVPVPKTTMWKVEGGLWVWYVKKGGCEITPMGCSDMSKIKNGQITSAEQLKKLTDPDYILARGREIVQASGVDKQEVTLDPTKESSAEVTFHNGQPGWVKLTVNTGAKLAGFSATLDKSDVEAKKDAVVKITYDPPAGAAVPPPHMVTLYIAPFNQQILISVKFAAPAQ